MTFEAEPECAPATASGAQDASDTRAPNARKARLRKQECRAQQDKLKRAYKRYGELMRASENRLKLKEGDLEHSKALAAIHRQKHGQQDYTLERLEQEIQELKEQTKILREKMTRTRIEISRRDEEIESHEQERVRGEERRMAGEAAVFELRRLKSAGSEGQNIRRSLS